MSMIRVNNRKPFNVIEDFNRIPKVSYNKRLNMYYHSISHVVFENKNKLEVIGRIERKQFVQFDQETLRKCEEHGLKPKESVMNLFNEREEEFREMWVLERIEQVISMMSGHLNFKKDEHEVKLINQKNNNKDNETSSDDQQCSICLTNVRSIVLIPCGHRCYCNKCFGDAKQHGMCNECPICRTKVESAIQSF